MKQFKSKVFVCVDYPLKKLVDKTNQVASLGYDSWFIVPLVLNQSAEECDDYSRLPLLLEGYFERRVNQPFFRDMRGQSKQDQEDFCRDFIQIIFKSFSGIEVEICFE